MKGEGLGVVMEYFLFGFFFENGCRVGKGKKGENVWVKRGRYRLFGCEIF